MRGRSEHDPNVWSFNVHATFKRRKKKSVWPEDNDDLPDTPLHLWDWCTASWSLPAINLLVFDILYGQKGQKYPFNRLEKCASSLTCVHFPDMDIEEHCKLCCTWKNCHCWDFCQCLFSCGSFQTHGMEPSPKHHIIHQSFPTISWNPCDIQSLKSRFPKQDSSVAIISQQTTSTTFIHIPTWGDDPIWLIFSNGLKPQTIEMARRSRSRSPLHGSQRGFQSGWMPPSRRIQLIPPFNSNDQLQLACRICSWQSWQCETIFQYILTILTLCSGIGFDMTFNRWTMSLRCWIRGSWF